MTTQISGPRQEAAAAEQHIDTSSIAQATGKSQSPGLGLAKKRLIAALRDRGCRPTATAARCPAHDDSAPSLSFSAARKFPGVVVTCHAGCTAEQIAAALGLTMADLYDRTQSTSPVVTAEYPYTDEDGAVLFIKERLEPKGFRLKRADGRYGIEGARRVLYRLPAVLAAVETDKVVYVVEGEKDADALVALGHTATCNSEGASGEGQASKWRSEYGDVLRGARVIVIADKDPAGRAHAAAIVADLTGKAASVVVMTAAVGKDVSEHLEAGNAVEDLVPATAPIVTLDAVHKVFMRWLGSSYDLTALDVVLSAAAVEQLEGDPVWLLMISGSGNAKTETVTALAGAGAYVTSTITSEGALLSATSNKEKTKDSTGGLLRKIGDHGLLVVKDFTSILSMNRDSRAGVLAALREVYDGFWERNVGTNGGTTLTWAGRIVFIGAVTSAYDRAHEVISSMGDRFALVRVDSNLGRLEAGSQALRNVSHEVQMRTELAAVVGDALQSIRPDLAVLTDEAMDVLLGAANLVTLIRTTVDRDSRGQVLQAHQPEAPTRFAKMLGQVLRGALSLGLDEDAALATAVRVAGDSVPPLRLLALGDVLEHPGSRCTDLVKRLQKPRTTLDRTLQELHELGLLVVEDAVVAYQDGCNEKKKTIWEYSLHPTVEPDVVRNLVTRNVTTRGYRERRESSQEVGRATDIAGDPDPDPPMSAPSTPATTTSEATRSEPRASAIAIVPLPPHRDTGTLPLLASYGINPKTSTMARAAPGDAPAISVRIGAEEDIRIQQIVRDLGGTGVPVDTDLLERRLAEGPQSEFVRALTTHLTGGRVHPQYSTDSVTGRLYSTIPNIQGAGRHTPELLTDRDLIVAEPGEILIGADLSGIDARAVAGLAGDPAYAALFADDRDIHTEASLMWFGDVAHREQAKAINHGLTNGQGAGSIAADSGLPVDDVQDMIEAHFLRFPGVATWQARLRADAEQGRPLATGTGRWVPSDPDRAYTTAPARAGQACARDLFVAGLFRLHQFGLLQYLRLALHDEVVLSVPELAAENILEFVVELMSFAWKSPSGLVIPIVAAPAEGSGRRWSDLYRTHVLDRR